MTLGELLDGLDLPLLDKGNLESRIRGISSDSRTVRSGDLFVCMPSPSRDTHDFLVGAAGQGATAAFCHSPEGFSLALSLGMGAALLPRRTSVFFKAAGEAAHRIFDNPTQVMTLVGVTGTNGKTSTAWMLRDALQILRGPSAYLGTLGFKTPQGLSELSNTTPWPVDLASITQQARKQGCSSMTLEASSHALVEERLAGVLFDVGVFTNLTQDHLDFHGTMEAYAEAKRLLFTQKADESRAAGKQFTSVINVGNATGASWALEVPGPVLTFGSRDADLQVKALEARADSLRLEALLQGQTAEFSLGFGGQFHIENASAALGALIALGHSLDQSCEALSWASATPGRFEPVHNDLGFSVLVDYAHTPDALSTLLASVRQLPHRRIITLFGCGGDRDRTKRPLMAQAAAEGSDLIILTSDNPRTEDPQQILNDAKSGLGLCESRIIPDRSEAIVAAVSLAQPGDILVLAGKGHENYQIIGKDKLPFDDREVARRALTAKG